MARAAVELSSHQAAASSCSPPQLLAAFAHLLYSGHGMLLPRRSWCAGCPASSTTSTATTSR